MELEVELEVEELELLEPELALELDPSFPGVPTQGNKIRSG